MNITSGNLFSAIKLLTVTSALTFCASCTMTEITDTQLTSDELPLTLTIENTGNFGPRITLPTPDEIHALTEEQEKYFLQYMNDPRRANIKAHNRLFQYLQIATQGFAYEGITYSASQTLELNSGDCMSLAILTTALAELAGLEIDYQLMDDVPVYELNGITVKKGVHIRTIVYDPDYIEKPGTITLNKPGIKIDYFPTNRYRFISNLNRNDYLATYYENMAVLALEEERYKTAYWNTMTALDYVPDHSPALNTLAIINRRTGNSDIAEIIYRYGIQNADEKLSLLKNYYFLLESLERTSEAEIIQRQLATMKDPSPFHWFQLARSSHDDGEYLAAIRYYNRALDRAPYLHEAWLGIAQANYEIGRLSRSRSALQAALVEAEKASTRNLYQAKLVSLSREMSSSPRQNF